MKKTRKEGLVFTELDEKNSYYDGRKATFVILDDICDGGRTFANTSKILKELYPKNDVVLAVSHAILPFGVELLKESGIKKIITTDSCFETGTHYEGFVEALPLSEKLVKMLEIEYVKGSY